MLVRVVALIAEVFVGLLVAGIVLGAVIPFVHGTVGPVSAALIALSLIVVAIVTGEALRRRKPMQR